MVEKTDSAMANMFNIIKKDEKESSFDGESLER